MATYNTKTPGLAQKWNHAPIEQCFSSLVFCPAYHPLSSLLAVSPIHPLIPLSSTLSFPFSSSQSRLQPSPRQPCALKLTPPFLPFHPLVTSSHSWNTMTCLTSSLLWLVSDAHASPSCVLVSHGSHFTSFYEKTKITLPPPPPSPLPPLIHGVWVTNHPLESIEVIAYITWNDSFHCLLSPPPPLPRCHLWWQATLWTRSRFVCRPSLAPTPSSRAWWTASGRLGRERASRVCTRGRRRHLSGPWRTTQASSSVTGLPKRCSACYGIGGRGRYTGVRVATTRPSVFRWSQQSLRLTRFNMPVRSKTVVFSFTECWTCTPVYFQSKCHLFWWRWIYSHPYFFFISNRRLPSL